MADAQQNRGVFHARLREVEPGVFRAEYRGEFNPQATDAHTFPDFHLGNSREAVRIWVEQLARSMGYEKVVWDSLPQ